MSKMLVLFLALFVSVVAAQQRCCLPTQYEAYMVQAQGFYNGSAEYPPLAQTINMNFSVDYDIQRIFLLFADGEIQGIREIIDWTQDSVYIIQVDESCEYFPMDPEDPPKCVPDEAQHVRNTWMGFDDEKLHVDDWQWYDSDYNLTFSFTQPECTSVYQTFSGPLDETSAILASQRFTGMTLGIRDPRVFEIPPNCQPGQSKKKLKKGHPIASIISMYAHPKKTKAKAENNVAKPQGAKRKLDNLIPKQMRNL